jgi:hypothetical protein
MDSDPLNQFHHVIVTGDLNYRLEYGDNSTLDNHFFPSPLQCFHSFCVVFRCSVDKPTETQVQTICADIEGNRFLSLYHQRDQLVRELSGGRVLNEFVDLQPNFKPTARLARGKSDYHVRSSVYENDILFLVLLNILCLLQHSSLPYWGGRVLYRSMRGFENIPGFAMQPNEFVSLPEISTRRFRV